MDQLETRDLPGNDASWYRALLVDQESEPTIDAPPEQQTLPISREAPEADTAPELKPIPPLHAPDEKLAEDSEEAEPPAAETTPDLEPILPPPAAPDEAPPEDTQDADPPAAETTPNLQSPPAPEAQPETAAEAESAEQATPDLIVASPTFTGDPEPVHFPDEEVAATPEPPPTAAVDAAPDHSAPNDTAAEPKPPIAPVPPVVEQESFENTSEMVGQLWTAPDEDTSFEAWEPDEMDSKIDSRRKFRWTSVIAALAVIGLIVTGLVLLPSMTRNRADAHREMMLVSLHDLRGELPDTQESLQVATEPASDVVALGGLSTQLTVLTAKASAVENAGRAPLPTAPPLTSTEPIDELVPIQQRLEPLASTAQAIQRRISNVAEYRMLMNGFLDLPELPTTADTATQADLRVELASAQAESASILAELPDDVSLSEHKALARAITESFATWQIDYLEALRTMDATTAAALIEDLDTQLAELDAALVTPLAQIRRQTDTDLIDLARSIDEVVAMTNGTEPAP